MSILQKNFFKTDLLLYSYKSYHFYLSGRKTSARTLKLSRVERNILQKIMAARRRINKLKNKVKKQTAKIKEAKKIIVNPAVLDVLENCLSTAKLLIWIQWREDNKKDKGRRFTLQGKVAALSIFKQSPKAYRFLRKIFILPANQTLAKVIQRCNLRPGLNKNIFYNYKGKLEKLKSQKGCALLFDEVSLKAQILYNEKKDKITGVVDNGQQKQPEFADHAHATWPNYKLL